MAWTYIATPLSLYSLECNFNNWSVIACPNVKLIAMASPPGHLALFMGFTKDKENSHSVYDPITCDYVKKDKKMMKKLAK